MIKSSVTCHLINTQSLQFVQLRVDDYFYLGLGITNLLLGTFQTSSGNFTHLHGIMMSFIGWPYGDCSKEQVIASYNNSVTQWSNNNCKTWHFGKRAVNRALSIRLCKLWQTLRDAGHVLINYYFCFFKHETRRGSEDNPNSVAVLCECSNFIQHTCQYQTVVMWP